MDEALGVLIAICITISIGAFAGKGCNDSDNKMLQEMAANGCSSHHKEHDGWQYDCPIKEKGAQNGKGN